MRNPFIYILLIITFLISNVHQAPGQEKVNLTIGIGIPELLNFGVHYQLNQVQIGLSVGGLWPIVPFKKKITISGDVHYHFGGYSKFSDRRPWYVRIGLNFMRENDEYRMADNILYLKTRIGRGIYISNKIGITIDIGAILKIFDEIERKSDIFTGQAYPVVFPSLGIGLFYRI